VRTLAAESGRAQRAKVIDVILVTVRLRHSGLDEAIVQESFEQAHNLRAARQVEQLGHKTDDIRTSGCRSWVRRSITTSVIPNRFKRWRKRYAQLTDKQS
jgi:hypothetical protein